MTCESCAALWLVVMFVLKLRFVALSFLQVHEAMLLTTLSQSSSKHGAYLQQDLVRRSMFLF